MSDIGIERRYLGGKVSLSWDLAQQIGAKRVSGKVVVVTNRPAELLAATRKQWLKIVRQTQRERACTLRAASIMSLSNRLEWMQRLLFGAKEQDCPPQADVLFMTGNACLRSSCAYSMIYITYASRGEEFRLLGKVVKGGTVVLYMEMEPFASTMD